MDTTKPLSGKQPATFQAYYQEPYNAIVRSHRGYLWYFRRRWMPELQPVGTAIVLFLRGLCYHNPDKGELRDVCECRLEDIGAGIGVSRATVARELGDNAQGMPNNPALRRFVLRQAQYDRTPAGIRRANSLYHVSMDDPLHPNDQEQYDMLCEQYRQRQEQADGFKPVIRDTRTGESQNETHISESQSSESHFEPGESQNETAYKTLHFLVPKTESTLNVKKKSTLSSDSKPDTEAKVIPPKLRSKRTQMLDKLVNGLVAELQDFGSERRHHQLLDICQQRNLDDLPRQALAATRKRLASEGAQGVLEKPGAYYQRILLALLEDHQVFVPKLGEGNPEEIRRLALQSLQDASKRS